MRSEKNTRKELLKERVKENIIGHQTVAHKNSFAENESIINAEKKEDQHTESFPYSRFLLHIKSLFWHRNFPERFPFLLT